MTDAAGASGLVLSPTAAVGAGVTFGAHVVVHDGVVIGDGCTIGDGAVLGKSPTLGARSTASRDPLDPLVLEGGVVIGTHAIVLAGVRIGAGAVVADQAMVRERCTVGRDTVVGRGSLLDNDVAVGARVKIQSNVYVTGFSVVEDDVFVGPCAMTTNDHTMGRHAKGIALHGAILRRACRVGGAAVLLPNVEIGEEAFVAAGAVVTVTVAPRKVVMGVPARVVRDVSDEELLENWS
jgi:UDP-2-acetamido-3-amino-2,3-dideoxy-glucuronate N-acetyltransferase